jgi:hypothetical protein
MSKNPWRDPDPQPGDFDADLATIDSSRVEVCAGDPNAEIRFSIEVGGEEFAALEQLAAERGNTVSEVIGELLRGAGGHAA